jgi:hypothetical protein
MGTSKPIKWSIIVFTFTFSIVFALIPLFLGLGISYSSIREQPWRSSKAILASNKASMLLDAGIPEDILLSYSECHSSCKTECPSCIVKYSAPSTMTIYLQTIESLEGLWSGINARLQIQDSFQDGTTNHDTWGDSVHLESKKVQTWIKVQLLSFDPQYYHQTITGKAYLIVTYPTPAGYGGLFHQATTNMDRTIQFYVVSPEEKDLLDEIFPSGGMGYFGLVLGPALIIFGVGLFFHLTKDVQKKLAHK